MAMLLMVISVLGANDGWARRGRRRKVAVKTKALGELMGAFRFGMEKKQILQILARQIGVRYKDKIKETTSVYKQDELRRKERGELARIKKSFLKFEGKHTGWDVSIVDDQFAHNSGESMMYYWENVGGKDQRRFFFFHEGKLFRMFIALNSNILKKDQRKFSYFKKLMERRYGTAKVEAGPGGKGSVLAWRSAKYHTIAIDKVEFYGSFCLSITDPSRMPAIIAAREAATVIAKKRGVVDSMITKDHGDEPGLDDNAGAVDSIIGAEH